MRSVMRAAVTWALLSTACAGGQTRTRAPAATDERGIAGLGWLSGRWVSRTSDSVAEEIWSAPSGRAMQGIGRVVRGDATVFFEFMTIEERDGGLVFTAWPNGRPATTFAMASQRRGEAAFANPAHDFPSRIVYRLDPDGRLFTHAEGHEGDRAITDDTHFDRAE